MMTVMATTIRRLSSDAVRTIASVVHLPTAIMLRVSNMMPVALHGYVTMAMAMGIKWHTGHRSRGVQMHMVPDLLALRSMPEPTLTTTVMCNPMR